MTSPAVPPAPRPKAYGRLSMAGALVLISNLVLLTPMVAGVRRAVRLVGRPDPATPRVDPKTRARQDFESAMTQVRLAGSRDIDDQLVALRPDTPALLWHPSPDKAHPRVLVATLTSYRGYTKHIRKTCKAGKGHDIWVTPVPQLAVACRGFSLSGAALRERTGQYLGLRPEDLHETVVELWVDPRDVFRPCPDPEVDDTKCRLGLPDVALDGTDKPSEHAKWFARNDRNNLETPYPWTRLGYTYDWGDPYHHIGASEYVVREGASVWVAAVVSLDAYCAEHSGFDRTMVETVTAGEDC
jgi:hypothetical protein